MKAFIEAYIATRGSRIMTTEQKGNQIAKLVLGDEQEKKDG